MIKNSLLIVTTASILSAGTLNTQQIQVKHPKKMYSAKSGYVFSPYGNLYMFVSPTLDGKDMTYVPIRAAIKEKTPIPLQLEGHGPHNLVHPEHGDTKNADDKPIPVTKDPLRTLSIFWDKHSPKLTLVEENSKKIIDSKHYYFPLNAKFNLYTKDANSGVDTTHISINGKTVAKKGKVNELILGKENKYTIELVGVDNVGNVSKVIKKSLTIDASSPVSSHSMRGYLQKGSETIFGSNGEITLESEDELSGVKTKYYKIDNKKDMQYLTTILPSKLKSGKHKISYYAVDNVGNKEPYKTVKFYTDTSRPTATLKLIGDKYVTDKYTFVSTRTTVNLTAKDYSGISSINYTLNNSSYGIFTQDFNIFEVVKDNKKFEIENYAQGINYYSVDKLNNRSKKYHKEIIVDAKVDKPTISFKGKHKFDNNINYITKDTKIILSAKDRLSGIKSMTYNYNGGKNTKYQKPFNITDALDSEFKIKAVAQDRVNNTSKEAKTVIFVDAKKPNLYSNFLLFGLKAEPISLSHKKGKIDAYSNRVQLTMSASDDGVGIYKIYYKLGKDWEVYKNPIELDKKGVYSIDIKATDRLGNTTIKNHTFKIISYRDKRLKKRSKKINFGR